MAYKFRQNTDYFNAQIKKWKAACDVFGWEFAPIQQWKWVYGKYQKPPFFVKMPQLISAFFGETDASDVACGICQDRFRQIVLWSSRIESDDSSIGRAAWSLIRVLLIHGDCMSQIESSVPFMHGRAMRKLHQMQVIYHNRKYNREIRNTIAEKKLGEVARVPAKFADVYLSPAMNEIIPWIERNEGWLTFQFRQITSGYTVPETFTPKDRVAFLSGWNYIEPRQPKNGEDSPTDDALPCAAT